jgi:hypothetical protein
VIQRDTFFDGGPEDLIGIVVMAEENRYGDIRGDVREWARVVVAQNAQEREKVKSRREKGSGGDSEGEEIESDYVVSSVARQGMPFQLSPWKKKCRSCHDVFA